MRKRNRYRNGLKKERWIMSLSAVFVLATLSVTGYLMREESQKEQDGYVVDFASMEQAAQKAEEQTAQELANAGTEEILNSDDLDYDPFFQEANSVKVENELLAKEENAQEETNEQDTEKKEDTDKETAKKEDTKSDPNGNDSSDSMSEGAEAISTAMLPTLDQYKYNPAIVIQAVEGESITAAAAGKVVEVYTDPQIGNAIRVDLGGGYELTYGQLANVVVSEGSFVSIGDVLGQVAAPTKYYSVEETNVYFKLTKEGTPVNPMTKLG